MHFSTATQIAASVACISWPMEMFQCPNYRFCPTQIRRPFHLLLMPSLTNQRECPQISGRKSDFPFTLHKMSPKICGLILSSPDVFLSLSMVISFLSFYLKCIVKHLTELYIALFPIQSLILFSQYFLCFLKPCWCWCWMLILCSNAFTFYSFQKVTLTLNVCFAFCCALSHFDWWALTQLLAPPLSRSGSTLPNIVTSTHMSVFHPLISLQHAVSSILQLYPSVVPMNHSFVHHPVECECPIKNVKC